MTIRENRTGVYLRVLEPGIVQEGDPWQLRERLNPHGSIPAINRCMVLDCDPEYAAQMMEMSGLGEWWKQQAIERQAQTDHWTTTMKE